MIASKDRSYYIGASDVSFVVGNWETKTFEKWYGTKQGLYSMDFVNEAMMAGTHFEHRILDFLDIPGMEKDKQIIHGRLRVNLDGNTRDTVYEVKTYRLENGFKIPRKYRQQISVQMYAVGFRKAYLVSYGLEEADYNNFFRDIETERLQLHKIDYDQEFIEREFVPKLQILSHCLEEGIFPGRDLWTTQAE